MGEKNNNAISDHHFHKVLVDENKIKPKQTPHCFIFLLSLVSFSLLFTSLFFANPNSTSSLLSYFTNEEISAVDHLSISCDRTDYHSDICFMSGDVRTHSPSSSFLLYSSNLDQFDKLKIKEEKIRAYTRKWETPLMKTIDEVSLRAVSPKDSPYHKCDVSHDVPALVFSAGGYTGNLFHAFNNGILPLYITSQHLNKKVVFVVLAYREWWHTKYEEILSQLSDYPIVNFNNDTRTHCFHGAIIGLRLHETLSIDPERLLDHKTVIDFRNLLTKAYETKTEEKEKIIETQSINRPLKLVVISRNGTGMREILNERDVARVAQKLGFEVEILSPVDTTQMKDIYDVLSTCDVAMGVHGAALTHFLFMKPGSTLIQIVPIGIDNVAWDCFGEPVLKMGVKYIGYKVDKNESSLFWKYDKNDIIWKDISDNKKINYSNWEHIKEVYLDQNVTLNLGRVRDMLGRVIRAKRMRISG